MSAGGRTWAAVLLPLVALAGGCWPSQGGPRADDPLGTVDVRPSAASVELAATMATADFGVASGGGVRHVRVRIVDSMDFAVRIAVGHDLTLAEPPRLCLVGPFSAPDDAGLSDPCWGEPDVNARLLQNLAQDAAGTYLMTSERPIEFEVQLDRGTVRCDYPPGVWQVELRLNPLVAGAAAGARYVPDAPFEVPISEAGPLQLLATTETRYCGLATAVYLQQGEPEVREP